MNSTVFLLSDFGTRETYVAQMKAAVIAGAPPCTSLVDLTHAVAAGSVLEGAFHLWAARSSFPPGSAVLAVVDPGVGTSRRGVICRAEGVMFVGPDNGLFGLLPIMRAWELPRPSDDTDRTFHGRDVFAPAAAKVLTDPGWVRGLAVIDPGQLIRADIAPPERGGEELAATVVHVDSFGNVLLWIDPAEYGDFIPAVLRLPSGRTENVTRSVTYGDGLGVLYLRNSQGCMELAVAGGRASDVLGVSAGDRVVLEEGTR